MDGSTAEEPPRVKFLCSFGGTILPRPVDGRLRYVGGETRIITLPRNATFDDLRSRAKDLFDGVHAIKYQQPEEDLDALVSVVNDDDVVNMMEENDKLKDGLTRLRIFLFPFHDHDVGVSSSAAVAAPPEGDAERRYVDMLNSVPDETPFGNLHRLKIPRVPSYETPWSPAGFSPGYRTPRELSSSSPSTGRFCFGGEEIGEQQHLGSPYMEGGNLVWIPPGGVVGEKAGFPGNLGHLHGGYDSGGFCEHCHMAAQRNQGFGTELRYHDRAFVEEQQVGFGPEYDGCPECAREREAYIFNQEMKMDHDVYANEKIDRRSFYHDLHGHDRDWSAHHSHVRRTDENRVYRNPPYVMDGSPMSYPYALGSHNGHHLPPSYVNHDDPHNVRPVTEPGIEVHHDQHTVGPAGVRLHVSPLEESGSRYGINTPSYGGGDGVYYIPHGSSPMHSCRRIQGPVSIAPSYDAAPHILQANGGSVTIGHSRGGSQVGSPMHTHVGLPDQFHGPWTGQVLTTSQTMLPVNGNVIPTSRHYQTNSAASNVDIAPNMNGSSQVTHGDSNLPQSDGKVVASASSANLASPNGDHTVETKVEEDKSNEILDVAVVTDEPKTIEQEDDNAASSNPDAPRTDIKEESPAEQSTCLPEEIVSGKNAEVEVAEAEAEAEAVKSGNPVSVVNNSSNHNKEEFSLHDSVPKNDYAKDLEVESDSDQLDLAKIEPTTAEEEALAKGLQTIKNDDLEEIRELGSGTYGAVYYGKWKGSDVAIKRIKASCFSGKPSERERLIADFWKEALILGSLHHPNVVSFYGVVRDGPDGSLATVSEFMVNGSLKQFLQKKDRTIDRRKRLILAMDASFGVEYLHEKNIVHFDLKCENLLVNMRDPHRPICKIGDLGLSKVKQHTMVSGGVRGTLPWMAPELLSGKSNMVTNKIDVYSFGIVMWELLTGEEPYAGMNCASIIGGIVNNTLRPQIPSWCDPEWKSLMESCWTSDPSERPSFSEISQKLRKMSAAMNIK